MKNILQSFIAALPGGQTILKARSKTHEHRRFAQMGNPSDIFKHHFETNQWGSNESVSGPGSTIAYTKNIRKEIPKLIDYLAVRTILDAPCGDYNWFRLIKWNKPITYIGGDIVKPLIDRNQQLYGNSNTMFQNIDITYDTLPAVDLMLCRDCLFHLKNSDVALVVNNFLKSKIKYILTSNHSACAKNEDIPTGSFRLLNLQLPPFGFGKPTRMIDDWTEGFPVRHLALWDYETLKNNLAANKAFQRLLHK